jgi:DMSO/TMAO reductase YedYZ molybdopterin-dependent catalytic subunit
VPSDLAHPVAVVSGDRQVHVAVADLDSGDRMRAVLDCTGGWYAEQEWAGVRLDRLLAGAGVDLPEGGSVDVVSATGYTRRLPLSDAAHLLLATSAAGTPLSAGHGAPVRLVAPGRRGFWWVKWVVRLEVVDAPWWVQSPFPLQ